VAFRHHPPPTRPPGFTLRARQPDRGPTCKPPPPAGTPRTTDPALYQRSADCKMVPSRPIPPSTPQASRCALATRLGQATRNAHPMATRSTRSRSVHELAHRAADAERRHRRKAGDHCRRSRQPLGGPHATATLPSCHPYQRHCETLSVLVSADVVRVRFSLTTCEPSGQNRVPMALKRRVP
jgi:hypothetical protein